VPALALTFDDGPDPVWTPRLLDLLGTLGARARGRALEALA
jgi:peptidoglycan/xylan/chitin deacetylase (PgdA/CDA1 family)